MRAIVLLLALCIAACTKPNPNRCCNDESDCSAKGIPVGSVCQEGLVCRGNQCIAQPCASSAECDAAAPYCVAELCAESCAEDAQCPGATQASDRGYCVGGECVSCRMSSDCDSTAPVCEAGTCRACTAHSECDTLICDGGQCIRASAIAYASPTGSTTSGCTQDMPCTLERAWSVVDQARSHIKLLGGTHAAPPARTFEHAVNMHGEGTIVGMVELTAANGAMVRFANFTVKGHVVCYTSGALFATSELHLDDVIVEQDVDSPYTGLVSASRCKLRVRNSTFRLLNQFGSALALGGAGGGGGQPAIIERTVFDLPVSNNVSTTALTIGDFATVHVSNSVFRGGSPESTVIGFGTNPGASSVQFSTFYNTVLKCPNSPVLLASRNNIFLNEAAGAPADTLTGTACTHNYVLARPQVTAVNGANNLVNMDPRFVDAANRDYRLLDVSPAVDAADPAATETVDFEGTSRPKGLGRDLGAFESH